MLMADFRKLVTPRVEQSEFSGTLRIFGFVPQILRWGREWGAVAGIAAWRFKAYLIRGYGRGKRQWVCSVAF